MIEVLLFAVFLLVRHVVKKRRAEKKIETFVSAWSGMREDERIAFLKASGVRDRVLSEFSKARCDDDDCAEALTDGVLASMASKHGSQVAPVLFH